MEKIKNLLANIKNFLLRRKKILIPLGLLAIVGIFLLTRLGHSNEDIENGIFIGETSILEKGNFQQIITENGTIISKETKTLYPELQSKVTGVNFKVGDQVNQGDVVVTLDNTEIYNQLVQAKASLEESERSRRIQIESAQNQLNEALINTSDQESQAQKSINQAYNYWQNTVKELEKYKKNNPNDTSSQRLVDLTNQEDKAEAAYLEKVENLNTAKMENKEMIEELKNSLLQASVDTSKSEKINIKNLEKQLDFAYLRAPISGTITELNVTVGEIPEGYVGKIETVNDLQVNSSVSEYDINKISEGTNVEITSNSLGSDRVFKGQVALVYPTPNSGGQAPGGDDMGASGPGGQGETSYKTVVSIDDINIEGLHPGMNVRVRYILQNRENVIIVPTNSIIKSDEGNFIYIINDETNTIESIEVNIEAENEVQSVINSQEISEGMRILNDPQDYQPGESVEIIDEGQMALKDIKRLG